MLPCLSCECRMIITLLLLHDRAPSDWSLKCKDPIMPRWIGDNSEVLPEPTSHSPRAKRWIPVQPKRGVWENGKAAFDSDPSGKV